MNLKEGTGGEKEDKIYNMKTQLQLIDHKFKANNMIFNSSSDSDNCKLEKQPFLSSINIFKKIEYCDTDLFLVLKINKGTLDNYDDFTNFFNYLIKKATPEEEFDFEKATMRYYKNNILILHSRVHGPQRDCNQKYEDQLKATTLAQHCILKAFEQFNLQGEFKDQLWVFYKADEKEILHTIENNRKIVSYHQIQMNEYTIGLIYSDFSIFSTIVPRNVAEVACNGLAYEVIRQRIQNNFEEHVNFNEILRKVTKYEKFSPVYRIVARKPTFSKSYWIETGILIIMAFFIIISALIYNFNSILHIGIALSGICSIIGMVSFVRRKSIFEIYD